MSLIDIALTPDVLDLSACRDFWRGRFHPAGPHCPRCGILITGRSVLTWADGGRVSCRVCGKFFTWRTGTPLQGKGIDARQLYLIAALFHLGLTTKNIANLCRISVDSVSRWHQFFTQEYR